MAGSQLPPKPRVAMPRLQDAMDGHAGVQRSWKEKRLAKFQQNELSTPTYSSQVHAGQKRKISDDGDDNTIQNINKKAKLTSQSADTVQLKAIPAPNPSQYRQFGTPGVSNPLYNINVNNELLRSDFIPSGPATLRWDKATKTFLAVEPDTTASDITNKVHPTNVDSTSSIATKQKIYSEAKRGPKKIPRIQTHEYNLRQQPSDQNFSKGLKRSAPEDLTSKESNHAEKRFKTGNNLQEPEVITSTPMHEIVAKNKKKNKYRPHSRKKAKNQTSLNMRLEDLIPHYKPNMDALARAKAREAATPEPRPKTFMDLPLEVHLNIWDKVFEDEAYKFSLRKYSTSDNPRHMIPQPPPSYNCLFIHPSLTAEVKEQMYKSMRLEIDFGRLRPSAMRKFMVMIGEHILGRESQRIFFIKKFGLHKVNMGQFAKAKEIISTHWTVEGDGKMDEDDYANNRIDPQHILHAPPSQTKKLKGLKDRRFWKDQLAASEQYKRHMEGRCHPESADPNQTIQVPDPLDPSVTITKPVEVAKKPCPFKNKCLNLKDTKFCIVVKYKFGCIKGRHSRHKEVLYDYYPATEELTQLAPPRSKFYKKCGRKGPGN